MSRRKAPLARTLLPSRSLVNGKAPAINSDWVEFDLAAIEILCKYLDKKAIDELQQACNFVGAMYHNHRANPSASPPNEPN